MDWPQVIYKKAWLAVEYKVCHKGNEMKENGPVFLCGECLRIFKTVIKLKVRHERRASSKINRKVVR